MLIGKKAPEICCEAVINNRIKNFSLSDIKDKYKVLFFYPLDFSFVCPTEMHGLQDEISEFENRDTVVLGISVDSVYAHKAWLSIPKEKGGIKGIKYPLLSDLTKSVSKNYCILDENSGKAFRGLFLIDKDNIIQAIQVNNFSLGRNIDEIIRLLDALQFVEKNGIVCPVNWQSGQEGLEPTNVGVSDYFSKEK